MILITKDEKITHRKKLNLTKKEILEKFRNRNLQFCNNRIQKTEEDANDKKNKIIKKFDNLKLSLDEFDNWNSPENAENLFEFCEDKFKLSFFFKSGLFIICFFGLFVFFGEFLNKNLLFSCNISVNVGKFFIVPFDTCWTIFL